MKAIAYTRYGGPDVLKLIEMPAPAPKAGEIQVHVTASAVTTADWRLRASAFPGGLWLAGRIYAGLFKPRKPVLGLTFAGTISALGDGVTDWQIGQRVYGFSGGGAHAETLTIPKDKAIAPTPDNLTDAEAAALPFGAVCAYSFLHEIADLKAGQRILIIGATGGVGANAVQIAHHMGAHVTAVCSTANHELARDLGADAVIDYHKTDPLNGPEAYDVVFDCVGASTYSRAIQVLRPGGLYLPLNFGIQQLLDNLRPKRKDGKHMRLHVNGDNKEYLLALNKMVEAGALRGVVDSTHPLPEAPKAHTRVASRHARGTVILCP